MRSLFQSRSHCFTKYLPFFPAQKTKKTALSALLFFNVDVLASTKTPNPCPPLESSKSQQEPANVSVSMYFLWTYAFPLRILGTIVYLPVHEHPQKQPFTVGKYTNRPMIPMVFELSLLFSLYVTSGVCHFRCMSLLFTNRYIFQVYVTSAVQISSRHEGTISSNGIKGLVSQ